MGDEGLMQRGFRITGRVQGVYFRVWARATANEMGLRGTVRNRLDGTVEAHVVGSPGAVSAFEARLWEGPAAAVVEEVGGVESNGELPPGPLQILPTD